MKVIALVAVLALLAPAAAFTAPRTSLARGVRALPKSAVSRQMTMEDTYWEGKAPPSKVLGPRK